MRILFDINHPVDINFFKKSIYALKGDGHSILIVFRDRGSLAKILEYEIPDIETIRFGSHQQGFVGKVVGQLRRDYDLVSFFRKKDVNLVVSFGPTSVLASKVCRIPYLAFDDDFEYKIPFYHANLFATRHIYPDFIDYDSSNTYKYNGFKELAYLHPNSLVKSTGILSKYGLKPENYVFIREISNVSLNYRTKNTLLSEVLGMLKNRNLKIVLSIENKELGEELRDQCIVLEEPVEDIFSLMAHSLFAISSGDTVARETSLMGVPTIYTGGRSMAVNKSLVDNSLMFEASELEGVKKAMSRFDVNFKQESAKRLDSLLKENWEDTTHVILRHIKDFEFDRK